MEFLRFLAIMYVLIILPPLSILTEAVVLRLYLLQSRPFWHSLLDSFLMNLVAGLLGFAWSPLFSHLTSRRYGRPIYPSYMTWASIAIYGALSVVIKGLILTLLEKGKYPLRQIWITSLLANILNYVPLFIALAVAPRLW